MGRERHRHGGLGWRAEGVDLTAQETEALVAFRLRRANPNLRVGKVTDAGKAFEVEVVTTKAGDLVERFWVDKATGRLADEPAPRE